MPKDNLREISDEERKMWAEGIPKSPNPMDYGTPRLIMEKLAKDKEKRDNEARKKVDSLISEIDDTDELSDITKASCRYYVRVCEDMIKEIE